MEQRFKQSALVFAIAILIGENLGCGVRLIAANAEIDSNVADAGSNETIECSHLLLGRLGVACDLIGLGAKCISGDGARRGEPAVPVADFLPSMKRRPGHGRQLVFGRFRGFVVLLLGPVRWIELAAGPQIDSAAIIFADGGLKLWTPDMQVLVDWNIESKRLREHNRIRYK